MAEMILRDAMAKALREALDTDDRTFLMGEDIGAYGGPYAVTRGFLEDYGEERIRDTPISEAAFVGAGTGAAMIGMRPIVEVMTINFSLVAIDQIVNHAAKLSYMSDGQISVPLIIRTVTGGGGQLAATHSQSFENWYASVPGLRVVVPATPYDALGLFRSSRKDNNPVIFAEHSLLYRVRGEVPDDYYEIPLGQARIAREGEDVTLVSYSGMVRVAEESAAKLAEKDISAEVIDLRTLSPFDLETVVRSVRKTNRVAVIEETWKTGGFSGTIASDIQEAAFDDLDGPVLRINAPDVPAPYARNIEQAMIPSSDWVVEAITYNFGL
ncbi:MAG: alpha-ketoacid dehydrogenase subunit beta [SAR202 cluster bacterium]|jgi:pyruvate dehydrogenase E1 component beta subunit|nr:alpha-ketoacid dehydrogenase subunit beta [Chloroflexota bacterium]MQG02898.1 alpha-ketoacid dehydrogenase subunit beta [SAR202 cluster bacterium]HAE32259.1 alpha-ketoacid dehydrogenase subunit beta [Dehalococcoidia bacterium]|tara:strand:+ start:2807 stop:3784 length:978 start_codon:yes stop_codon:yes gene_type:complete